LTQYKFNVTCSTTIKHAIAPAKQNDRL